MTAGNPNQLVLVLYRSTVFRLPDQPLQWEGGSGRRCPRAEVPPYAIELAPGLYADHSCAFVHVAGEPPAKVTP